MEMLESRCRDRGPRRKKMNSLKLTKKEVQK